MINVLIVGAGPTGLCAAKTFLQYNQHEDLLLLDAHASLGGVWSREKLYPNLKTNNLHSGMDFFGFPLDERFGSRPGEHISGESMNAYLHAFADRFHITPKIQLNTRVLEIARRAGGDGWCVTVDQEGKVDTLDCRKLVIATGILSVPHLPELAGIGQFQAPFIHSSELGDRAEELTSSPDIQTIGVLGGCKSAYDAVYMAASSGHKVDWVIRKSGRGPVWVFPPHTYLGPIKAWRERLITRRFFTFMSPWVFADFSGVSWLRDFLHFNAIGKFISQSFWKLIHADNIRDCELRTDPKFKVLEPEQNPFWYGTASGTLNYETKIGSFIQSGLVQVHREDISHLSPKTIHLADGTELGVDAFVVATGYSSKPTLSFTPADTHSGLGLPTTDLSEEQRAFWQEQDTKADLAIGARYPRLLKGPSKGPSSSTPAPFHPGASGEEKYTPWRLYRGIAPPALTASGDRSLVFLGMFSNIANSIRLEIQCLWALAYLHDKLPTVNEEADAKRIFQETAQFQRFAQLRSPYGHGRSYPDLNFDQMPYWDVLLADLGLRTQRKANVFRELFEPYTQEDYDGIVEEWIQKIRGE